MKEIVHNIVCDVCNEKFEVDPETQDLKFSLGFKRDGGYSYNDNLEVDLQPSDVKMDICSLKCLYDYAREFHQLELDAVERRKKSNDVLFFGRETLPPISGDCTSSLEERLLKDGSLPPNGDFINHMIDENAINPDDGTQHANPILQTSTKPPTATETCNVGAEFGYDKLKDLETEKPNGVDGEYFTYKGLKPHGRCIHLKTITHGDPEFGDIVDKARNEADEIIKQIEDMVEPDEDMVTLSNSYYMIVKSCDDGIYLGNGDRPIPLNTCIQFDTSMIVFQTVDDAVVYRDVKMGSPDDVKIVEVICDPVDYHSNDGRVQYALFPSN